MELAAAWNFFGKSLYIILTCEKMMQRQRRVANGHLAAKSIVRLIETMKPAEPDEPVNVILKPKDIKKRLPGTALLVKLAKQRQREKEKRAAERMQEPEIDDEVVDEAMSGIFTDLGI